MIKIDRKLTNIEKVYLHEITHVVNVLLLLCFLNHLLLLVSDFVHIILLILDVVWRWRLLNTLILTNILVILFLDQFDIMFARIFLWFHPDNFFVIFLLSLRDNLLLFGRSLIGIINLTVDLVAESTAIEITVACTSPFALLCLGFLRLMPTSFFI